MQNFVKTAQIVFFVADTALLQMRQTILSRTTLKKVYVFPFFKYMSVAFWYSFLRFRHAHSRIELYILYNKTHKGTARSTKLHSQKCVGIIAARRAHIFNCCDCPLGTTSFYMQELLTSSSYFESWEGVVIIRYGWMAQSGSMFIGRKFDMEEQINKCRCFWLA
jgi:hypothetical protein